ncbi:hypothetical protein LZ31DRAFT_545751 [Colletotrichum somersetense]|nr:hypothetical protein LZ31DRAFT_545751 [Colletotrichum somersetense]
MARTVSAYESKFGDPATPSVLSKRWFADQTDRMVPVDGLPRKAARLWNGWEIPPSYTLQATGHAFCRHKLTLGTSVRMSPRSSDTPVGQGGGHHFAPTSSHLGSQSYEGDRLVRSTQPCHHPNILSSRRRSSLPPPLPSPPLLQFRPTTAPAPTRPSLERRASNTGRRQAGLRMLSSFCRFAALNPSFAQPLQTH